GRAASRRATEDTDLAGTVSVPVADYRDVTRNTEVPDLVAAEWAIPRAAVVRVDEPLANRSASGATEHADFDDPGAEEVSCHRSVTRLTEEPSLVGSIVVVVAVRIQDKTGAHNPSPNRKRVRHRHGPG